MQDSKPAKNTWKYLPVLVVLVTTIAGLLIGKQLYSTPSDSQSSRSRQGELEPNNAQPPIVQKTLDACGAAIYTSLPPKCRTFDGEFIPLPGASVFVVTTPEGK